MHTFPGNKLKLYELGKDRVVAFCNANSMSIPVFKDTPAAKWRLPVCAYYRRTLREPAFIDICIYRSAFPCGVEKSRCWSWPGSTIDRTPFGVLAHELGHHVDAEIMGPQHHREYGKGPIGPYYSDWSTFIMQSTGDEKCFSPYAYGEGVLYCEWFAEMFRLFVTNEPLLKLVAPKTWHQLIQLFKPVKYSDCWITNLGKNVPPRVVTALRNKIK